MKRIIYIAQIAAILTLMSGCESFLSIDVSPQLVESKDVFGDEETALSAANGVFVQMRATSLGIGNGGVTVFTGLAGDELVPTNQNDTYTPFFLNSIPVDNAAVISQLWAPAYRVIYQCNSIIEQLEEGMGEITVSQRHIIGEMKVVRAFHYFYLVNIFGDVPLPLTTNYVTNSQLARSDKADVLKQIVDDLNDAKTLLPEFIPNGKVRPTTWAATALLARVHLFLKDYEAAATYAGEVIESGNYALERDLSRTFQVNSAETIWELASRNATGNTAEAGVLLPANPSSPPILRLTESLSEAFDNGDLRTEMWIGRISGDAGNLAYARKYNARTHESYSENLVVLRLAELHLLKAEALFKTQNIEKAVEQLNIVRERAGLQPLYHAADNLLQDIQTERKRELFAEWGHRWCDLKRWGLLDQVMPTVKPNWISSAAIFPIPDIQIRYNPNLNQNPGY